MAKSTQVRSPPPIRRGSLENYQLNGFKQGPFEQPEENSSTIENSKEVRLFWGFLALLSTTYLLLSSNKTLKNCKVT